MDSVTVFTYPEQTREDAFAEMITRLKRPRLDKKADVVLDTDTYNEVDDQYAIAYMLSSQDRLNIQGIFAAPFQNHHADGTKEGMELSYQEILHVLELCGYSHYEDRVFKGADAYMPDEETPMESDAARKLIDLAMAHTKEDPLYVICIAAPVNVASAILMEPEIVNRIVVVWSGGVGINWPDCKCFNGGQNVAASRVLMQSLAPLVLTPGRSVGDHLLTTGPELEYWLKGKNNFCDYIVEKTVREAEICYGEKVWSRPLTDVVPVSWVVGGDFLLDRYEKRPVIEYDLYYNFDPRRPMMRYVYYIKRDNLMNDLFVKLASLQ